MKPKRVFRRLWLIPGVFLTILLAEMFPHLGSKEGPLNPELTVEYGVVSLINFMSGLATAPGGILRIILHFRVHLFIQFNALIFMPLFVKLMTLLISKVLVDEWVLNGVITLSCLPPPVLCSVVMTRSVQGNKEVAMFNSVLGNLLGIFISPLMMLLLVRSTSLIPLVSTIVQMVLTVLMPMLAGEMVGWLLGFQDMYVPVLNTLSELALLVTLFTMYCQTFEQTDMDLDAHAVLSSITLVVLLLLVATFLVFTGASHLPRYFQPEEVIAILFCSTHKSLTLGIPLLHAMYGGYSHYKTISLPLLVYYPSQVIVACLLSIPLTQWMKLQHRKRAALD